MGVMFYLLCFGINLCNLEELEIPAFIGFVFALTGPCLTGLIIGKCVMKYLNNK